jgi:hypothetical protein
VKRYVCLQMCVRVGFWAFLVGYKLGYTRACRDVGLGVRSAGAALTALGGIGPTWPGAFRG